MFARLQPLTQLWLIEMVSSWRTEGKLVHEAMAGLTMGEQIQSHPTPTRRGALGGCKFQLSAKEIQNHLRR